MKLKLATPPRTHRPEILQQLYLNANFSLDVLRDSLLPHDDLVQRVQTPILLVKDLVPGSRNHLGAERRACTGCNEKGNERLKDYLAEDESHQLWL